MMITDPDEAKEQLLQWSSDYAKVEITEAALTLDGISIDAAAKLNNGYSVASVFLQVRDPEISLMRYRTLCKDFKVADAIKASDKAQIVAEFTAGVPTDSMELQQQQPPQPAAAVVDTPVTPQQQQQPQPQPQPPPSSKEKHRSSKSSSSAGATSSSGHKRPPPPPPPGGSARSRPNDKSPHHNMRKKHDLVPTKEQLFANLNVVVDKRSVGLSKIEAAITNALSTAGFEVTDATILDEAAKKRTEAIMAKEIPVGNSASILRSNDPRKDLRRVLELYKESVMASTPKDKDHGKTSSSGATAAASYNNNASNNGSPSKRNLRSHLVGQKPVIVVPKGMTAPITLLNAHAFFHGATFTPRDQIKSKTNVLTKFTRNVFGTIPVEFEITDNPNRFFENGTKGWDRIVAVIVLGQDWQFKDWIPGFNAPATLFERVFGYYVGDKPPAQWAVKIGNLHRDKRALDSISYTSFWTQLEEWMRVHKPELILKTTSTTAD